MRIHYVYRITHTPTGRFYIGKHSQPAGEVDNYMGSGLRISEMLKAYPASEFVKDILETFDTEQAAFEGEAKHLDGVFGVNSLCLNLTSGGDGCSASNYWAVPENREAQSQRKVELHASDPTRAEAHSQRLRELHAERPEIGKKHSEFMVSFFSNPENRAAQSARRTAYFSNEENRRAASDKQLAFLARCDEEQLDALADAHRAEYVKLHVEGAVVEVARADVDAHIQAGAEFTSTNTALHHPELRVWLLTSSGPAAKLLRLDAGWSYGQRTRWPKVSARQVDKLTGVVRPSCCR